MRRLVLITTAAFLLAAPTGSAWAHFLFIRIGEQAEAGRSAEVFFSEYATAGDPRYIARFANTQLWEQTAPGEFRELTVRQATDRLRAFLPSNGTVSVVGRSRWGVLRREVPFLLEYYPKAISGDPALLNQFQPRADLPLEIAASLGTDGVTLRLLDHGKPVPNAKFTTVDDDLVNEELTANESGEVTWKPESPGHYCVYARVTIPESGALDGEEYTEIRRFATIAFNWPAARADAQPKAVELFKNALAARAMWREFPGFSAKVSGMVDGRDFSGTVEINKDGTVKLDIGEEPVASWVNEQLSSLVMHRLESSHGAEQPVLRFADNEERHPLGRLLTFVGGRFASSYRVRGDEITVVNRNFGDENMTINVLSNERNADGQQLPGIYTVQYWNAKDGGLLRTQTFQHAWKRVGKIDLPTSLTMTESSSSGLSVRRFALADHQLVGAE